MMALSSTSDSNNTTIPIHLGGDLIWNWAKDLKLSKVNADSPDSNQKRLNIVLEGTVLNFSVDSEAQSFANRLKCIRQIVADMVKNCPREEHVALISLGSEGLLMEYLLAKALIENGYQNFSFYPVDPEYQSNHDPESPHDKQIAQFFKDFRRSVESAYFDKFNVNFPKEQIHFFTRAHNVKKYFMETLNNPNVVLLESFSPYHGGQYHIENFKLNGITPSEMSLGNRFVPAAQANSIAFLPKIVVDAYKNKGVTFKSVLPFGWYDGRNMIEWNCKIHPDGKFCLNLIGFDDFVRIAIGKKEYEDTNYKNLFANLKNTIEGFLVKSIKALKEDDSNKDCWQEGIELLLLGVKKMFDCIGFECQSFHYADYGIDRSELVSFLSKNAGYHYRKAFSFSHDVRNLYKIDETIL